MSWNEIAVHDCTVTVCVSLIFFVIAFKFFRNINWHLTKKLEENTNVFSGQCKFPDCIRCRRHKDILMRARTKLTYYEDNQNENSALVSAQLLKDIQESYQKLTKDTKQESHCEIVDLDQPKSLSFHARGIRSQPLWTVDDFAGLGKLTESVEDIQRECEALMNESEIFDEEFGFWKVNDTPNGKWKMCHLLDQGVQTKAVRACPKTWQAVSSVPGAMTDNLFGNIAFSVVEPGTKITPHFGPTNIRIRCHLGLQVPKTECLLTVGSASVRWTEGKILCFDETFFHGVEHSGRKDTDSGARVILIIDLWHPELSSEQQDLINYAFSPTGMP